MKQYSFIILISGLIIGVQSESENSLPYFGTISGETYDPINIEKDKVVNVTAPPLLIQGNLLDNLKMVNNGKLVQATINDPPSGTTITGGVLGTDLYELYSLKHVWTNDTEKAAAITIDGKGFPMEILAVFFNKKYETFEKAQQRRDGLTIVHFPITICPFRLPNIFFAGYAAQLKKLKEPGSSSKTDIKTAALWFALEIIPFSSYYAYPGSYLDEITGQRYYSATIIIITQHIPSCLSKLQIKKTFGTFKNPSGEPLTNTESRFPRRVKVVRAVGILQTYV